MSDVATGNAFVGGTMCVLGCPSNCTTTDATGAYTLTGAPAPSGIVASMTGYVTENWPMSATGTLTYNANFRSTSLITTYAQQAGATFDGTTGAALFVVYDASENNLSGATVSTGGQGKLVYTNTAGVMDPALTATTSKGSGLVFQLPAGTANFTFAMTGATCVIDIVGWSPTTSGATLSAPIVAGQLTIARARCQ